MDINWMAQEVEKLKRAAAAKAKKDNMSLTGITEVDAL